MATEEELAKLVVKLTGDSSEYLRTLKESTAATKEATASIKGTFDGVKGVVSATVTALASFGSLSFLKESFASFDKAEQGMIRLTSAVRASGADVDTSVGKYRNLAKQISENTMASKGDVMALATQAEQMGFSGDAAERMIKNSVALAAAKGGEAQEYFRAAMALEMGNTQMIKYSLGLRGVKDDSEVLTRAQNLLKSGYEAQGELFNTVGGQLEKLNQSYSGLHKEFGKIVADAIKPFVGYMRQGMEVIKGLNEEQKKWIVYAAAVAAGILMIGPALLAVKVLLAPLIALVAAFVSPITILGTAATVVIGYFVDWGNVITWFTGKWDILKGNSLAAINNIKDALAAGNIQLAAEIAWNSIKLSFMQMTQGLQNAWNDFVLYFKVGTAKIIKEVRSWWEEATTAIAETGVMIAGKTGALTKEETTALVRELRQMNKEVQADINKTYTESVKNAQNANKDAIEATANTITDLKARMASLASESAWAAFFADADKKADKVGVVLGNSITKNVREAASNVQAALAGSAEAFTRLQAYRDSMDRDKPGGIGAVGGEQGKKGITPEKIAALFGAQFAGTIGGVGGAAGGVGNMLPFVPEPVAKLIAAGFGGVGAGGGAEALPTFKEMLKALVDIKVAEQQQAKKAEEEPDVEIKAADF
jgi:polyhydroxyalkanoate synthesis regulator phasin